MSNDRTDERTKRMRELLTCPKCRRSRVLVKSGVVCEMWACGGIHYITKKERAEIRKFLRDKIKDEQGDGSKASPYLKHLE